jgi:hypothetical protein
MEDKRRVGKNINCEKQNEKRGENAGDYGLYI